MGFYTLYIRVRNVISRDIFCVHYMYDIHIRIAYMPFSELLCQLKKSFPIGFNNKFVRTPKKSG